MSVVASEKIEKIAPTEVAERGSDKPLSTLKLIRKRLQSEGIYKKLKSDLTGFSKKSEVKKVKAISVIKRKKNLSAIKIKKHKTIKTPYVIENSTFKIEISDSYIHIFERRKGKENKLFASFEKEPNKELDLTQIADYISC